MAGKKRRKHAGRKTISSGMHTQNNSGNISNKQNSELSDLIGKQLEVRTFLLSKDTNLTQLGKDLIAESNKENPKMVNLIIDDAKDYKIADIEKLRSIVLNIPIDITVIAIHDIDFIEFLALMFLNTGYINIEEGVNISMDSVTPISDSDLQRLSKMLEINSNLSADEISDYYKNKAVIQPDMILKRM